MKLEEAFERVVVISLPFKADRRDRLKAELLEREMANPEKIHWVRAICGDWTPAPPWWGASNGAWGCLMSHVRVAQDAVHDKVSSYCILEDDATFHKESSRFLAAFMKNVPKDWGQVYLGGQFLHREPELVNEWVLRPYNVNRTHAFALTQDTIPRFLQHILNAPDYFSLKGNGRGGMSFEHHDYHVDHQLGLAHELHHWNTYAPTWWIAGQCEGDSSISGRTNRQTWWHLRSRGLSLPLFFVPSDLSDELRALLAQYLHAGYSLLPNSFTDIGLLKTLDESELRGWLEMIAGEAMEVWRLPAFECPKERPDLLEKVKRIWKPGVYEAELSHVKECSQYPYNRICGPAIDF